MGCRTAPAILDIDRQISGVEYRECFKRRDKMWQRWEIGVSFVWIYTDLKLKPPFLEQPGNLGPTTLGLRAGSSYANSANYGVCIQYTSEESSWNWLKNQYFMEHNRMNRNRVVREV